MSTVFQAATTRARANAAAGRMAAFALAVLVTASTLYGVDRLAVAGGDQAVMLAARSAATASAPAPAPVPAPAPQKG